MPSLCCSFLDRNVERTQAKVSNIQVARYQLRSIRFGAEVGNGQAARKYKVEGSKQSQVSRRDEVTTSEQRSKRRPQSKPGCTLEGKTAGQVTNNGN